MPYGEEILELVNSPTNKMFTGHERDSETGLDYMFARYYGGGVARFLSPDPLSGSGTDPQSLNLYTYVHQNPLNYIDPTGMYGINPNPYNPGNTNPCDGRGPMCHGQGSGFTDKEWKKYDKAQRKAAKRMEKAHRKLLRAANRLQSGKSLKQKFLNRFEQQVGAPATVSRLLSAAQNLSAGAAALRDDGSNGYWAYGIGGANPPPMAQAWTHGANSLAAASLGGKNIYVNLGHPSFGMEPVTSRSVGHESLHNAGMSDQQLNGVDAQIGVAIAVVYQLANVNPNVSINNPDNLMLFVYNP